MKSCAYVFLWGVILLLTLVAGCKENAVEPVAPSTISGTVMREDNSQAVIGAIVVDVGARAAIDTSDQSGAYSLPLGVLSSQYSTTLITTAMGFFADTLPVTVQKGENLTVNIRLRRDTSQQIINGISGRAFSITLVAQTAKTIALRGTGLNESSTLTFLVVDSLNAPVVGNNRCWVKFYISASHYSGEYVSPSLLQTDARGQVSTNVFSGTEPNVIQVFALVLDSTRIDTVKASPVTLTSGGGFPDGRYVSISASKYNIAGRVYDGLTTNITMSVSDRYGNPVADGTQVSFRSTAGIITSSVGTTNGVATAELKSGGGSPAPPGLVMVTAETKGDSSYNRADSLIVRTVQILFSGYPTIALDTSALRFTLPDGSMNYFDFTVSDDNGMPLVQGSTISVTVDGDNPNLLSTLKLEGNEKTIADSRNPNSTRFRVYVYDKTKDGLSGPIWFNITVTSQNYSGGNGSYTMTRWFSGYMQGTQGIGPYGVPTTLALADSLPRLLYLNETQLPDTSTRITFVVKDGTGNPYIQSRLFVTFALQQAPAGTYITPASDSTGPGGLVSVTVNSGNVPGMARVIATAFNGTDPPFTALSMPIEVAHGLPDSNQIILSLQDNMFNSTGAQVGTVRLSVADIWGSFPTPQYIRFTTSGGVVAPAAVLLDNRGTATTSLFGGSVPVDPVRGFGNVTVFVAVHGGVTVTRKIPFLFSGSPVVTTLNVPASDTIIVYDGGFVDVDYKVSDANRNPLIAGNNISVNVGGFASGGIRLSNSINTTFGGTDTNTTNFRVRISDAFPSAGPSGNFDVTISVNGPSGNTSRHFNGYLAAPNEIIVISPGARRAAQVGFIGVTAADISVAGVGNLENSFITYEVRDSLGVPVAASPRYGATFSYNFYPNSSVGGGTFPKVIPGADSTDSQGRLHASIVSGTQAGVVEIVARLDIGSGNIIISEPVRISIHAGFPDQDHFTLMPSRFVFPSFDSYNEIPFTVAIGDTFSNPVPVGTAVYFHSQAGVMETGQQYFLAYTNTKGLATANLHTSNPPPATLPYYDPVALSGRIGGEWVAAQTQGRGGVWIADSVLVIWNQAPLLIGFESQAPSIGPFALDSELTLPHHGASRIVTMTVTDINGNPMCDGSTISPGVTYVSTTVSELSFDVAGSFSIGYPAVIPNAAFARFPGPGITSFRFQVVDNSLATFTGYVTLKLAIYAPGVVSQPLLISFPVRVY
jgi:hypothetical protein